MVVEDTAKFSGHNAWTDEAGTSASGPVLPGVASLCSSPPQPETIVAGRNSAPYPINRCTAHPDYYPISGSSSDWNGSMTEHPLNLNQPECYYCLQVVEQLKDWMLGKPQNYVNRSCLTSKDKSPEFKRRRMFKVV